MGYYNILITDAANKICTMNTPFRKYEYNHLPIGVFIALDMFQEQMSALTEDLEFVRVYIGNFIIITYGSFEYHLAKVEEVMNHLQLDGLKFKLDKWKFAVPKVE